MDVGLGEAGNGNVAQLDVLPAKRFGGLDLAGQGVACFIADAAEDNGGE